MKIDVRKMLVITVDFGVIFVPKAVANRVIGIAQSVHMTYVRIVIVMYKLECAVIHK